MFDTVKHWFERRLGLAQLIGSVLHDYEIPRDLGFRATLGFVALVGFIVQTVTGMLLLMFYIPHPDHAFSSVQGIMNDISFGWLFRMMHVIGSNLIIACVFLHLVFVFHRGSYKSPREITWLTGGILLLFTLLFSVTGYLLPWHQLSYWSTTILTTIPTVLPFFESISLFIKGGEFVSGVTLTRFFGFHVALLPLLALLMVIIHVFLVRRIGYSTSRSGVRARELPDTFAREVGPESIPLYPDFLLKCLTMVLLYFSLMFFILAFLPNLFLSDAVNDEANPLLTPEVIKPLWYFLAPYQLIKFIPNKFVGIGLNMIFIVIFFVWPFYDRKLLDKSIQQRPVLHIAFYVSLALWLLLTVWGMY